MSAARADPSQARLGDALGLAISVALLTTCLTLVFLGMRAVMDIGGACADGGPYVSARPCPDGVPLAMVGGIFGIFLFGALVFRYGSRVGGPLASLALLAWPALFCSLGWNFLDYGLISPPEGEGIIWSWLIPGVLFEVMGLVPLVGLIAAWRSGSASAAGAGPVRPAPRRASPGRAWSDAATPDRASPGAPAARTVARGSPPATARQAALSGLASSFGAAAALTAASARLGGIRAGSADAADLDAGPAAELVDRLEALAELREKGLLEEREYEAAKAAVLRDLEALP